uniref:Uncharacterized protein n=1 Tax=Amphimedon queenslandica TaxID=400682 RepID=A0A1X7ULM0_AMPQE
GILSSTVFIETQLKELCATYSPYSTKYKFCPGIAVSEYQKFKEIVSFDPKDVRISQHPTARIDSKSCEVWHSLGERLTVSREKREADAVLCHSCMRLNCNLSHQVKKTMAESPSKKKLYNKVHHHMPA